MGQAEFQFEGQGGPVFSLDLDKVDDLDTLQRLISRDFGVIKPEGNQILSVIRTS